MALRLRSPIGRPLQAAGPIAIAAALASCLAIYAGCTFPEYGGFEPMPSPQNHDGGKDSSIDELDSEPGEDAPVTPDVVNDKGDEPAVQPDAEAGVDAGPDAPPDVSGPDAPADAPIDVPADVPKDVPVEASPPPPLLNVWHIPTNVEPPSVTMRNKRYPLPGEKAYVYFGAQPNNIVSSGKLYWWWSGEPTPKTADFKWDSNNGNNAYYIANFDMPARPVGQFRYYIEVTPANSSAYSKTWLYGTDTTTNKTGDQMVANAAPYKPDVAAPALGQIVITEIMVNARGSSEGNKEWFELLNVAAVPLSLNGCKFGDAVSLNAINDPELILWPGVYVTSGATKDIANMEGFVPDYAHGTGMSLGNTGDQVRIALPNDSIIDAVNFSTGWGTLIGTDAHSIQLKKTLLTATDNDTSTNWCVSPNAYGAPPTYGTSYGTPNAVSDCP